VGGPRMAVLVAQAVGRPPGTLGRENDPASLRQTMPLNKTYFQANFRRVVFAPHTLISRDPGARLGRRLRRTSEPIGGNRA